MKNQINMTCRISNKKSQALFIKCVLLVLALCFNGCLCAFSEQSHDLSPAFESFLTTNITIERVIFTRETFIHKSYQDEQDNTHSVKGEYLVRTSGGDYLLSVLKNDGNSDNYQQAGVDAGRYNGTTWHNIDNTLVLADSKSGQIDPQDGAIRASVSMIAKLGIGAFFGCDSFTYDNGNHSFELINSNITGGKVLVQLAYSNGVPNAAIIRTETNSKMVNRVTYSYKPTFHNGRFPVELSSYLEVGGSTIKLFTIHIFELSTINGILPASLIDPTLALNSKPLTILTSKDGSLFTQGGHRVLTAIEILHKKPEVAKHIMFVRICIISLAMFGLFIIFILERRQKQNK